MILGRINGKSTTNRFSFDVIDNARKFEYVQAMHTGGFYVLAQIVEIERTSSATTAYCNIIGYRDNSGLLKGIDFPLNLSTEVLIADDVFVQKTLGLSEMKNGAYIGTLNGREKIKVFIDLNRMITKHVSILAKSGSGKSFLCSVLVEELIESKVPVVIIDPHAEYSSLKFPNSKDKEAMVRFSTTPKGYSSEVREYSPDIRANTDAKPLRLNSTNLTPTDIIQLLPAKLSSSQLGMLYSALKGIDTTDFNEIILQLEMEESSLKWTLINNFEYVKQLNLFSENFTQMNELVQSGKVSIINMRGVPEDIQGMVVYKLVKDLFNARKLGNIPPFFLVIEEAHNYIPERSFGETKSSPILRQICAEGRKFGVGVCLISQRPSRVEKNALSQVTTQMVLKVTNPNDLRAISNSVEGITSESENEIKNLAIGTAIVTGIVDSPLFVNVRPRRTKHGGEAIDVVGVNNDFVGEVKSFESVELLPLVMQNYSVSDVKLMNEVQVNVKTRLIPCVMLSCRGSEDFNLLVDLNEGRIIRNIENLDGLSLSKVSLPALSPQQEKIFNITMQLGSFKASEIFAKSGLQFSEIYDMINILVSKGCLVKEGERYSVSSSFKALAGLQQYACFEKVQYKNEKYDIMLEKKLDADKVREIVGKFAVINNSKDCYLMHYEVSRA